MIRISGLAFAAIVMFGVAGCTPKPTEEAKTTPAAAGTLSQADMQKAAAAAAAALQAGALNDPNMSAADRAKLQAVYGNIAAGRVDPAAAAYLDGLNKAMVIIGSIKDEAAIPGAK